MLALAGAKDPPHWVYTHRKGGPSDANAQHETWGAWGATCPVGRLQSPIDIISDDVAVSAHLQGGVIPQYAPASLVAMNSGHAFQAELAKGETAGHTSVRGEDFVFAQVHWHAPSEHTFDGKHMSMEGHFVHQSTDKETATYLAVVGILFEETEECNAILEQFWDAFPVDGTVGPAKDPTDKVDLMALLTPALADGYYHYIGSLTTPPCTEGVDWNVAKGVLGVCKAQLDRLKQGLESVQDGVGINNRVTQPVHQRDVTATPLQGLDADYSLGSSVVRAVPFLSGMRDVHEHAAVISFGALAVAAVAGGLFVKVLAGFKERSAKAKQQEQLQEEEPYHYMRA